mgnify:CR=1 FL=1
MAGEERVDAEPRHRGGQRVARALVAERDDRHRRRVGQFAVFEKLIEEERARVVASGVPAASYYQTEVMGKGLIEVVDELAPPDTDDDAP